MEERPKVRLYVEDEIVTGRALKLAPPQSHYLVNVMRMTQADRVEVFNGQSDAFAAQITVPHRKSTILTVGQVTAAFQPASDLWLLFAPIKKARTDFIVEKATELGAAQILPVFTDFTNAERLRLDRLRAHCIEAAEQCGGTYVPELQEPQKLRQVLAGWPEDRTLFFADEATQGAPISQLPKGPAAILIGPEGGFSEPERALICQLDQYYPMELGPRILRADTAVVAALARWQSEAGDW